MGPGLTFLNYLLFSFFGSIGLEIKEKGFFALFLRV